MTTKSTQTTQATQTFTSFKDKWQNNQDLAFSLTSEEKSDIYNWILTRNGFENKSDFIKFLESKKRILDAGCGNGRVTALLATLAPNNSSIVGVDLTAAEVAANNLKQFANVKVHQGDLLGKLEQLGEFDFIYCQEVLHHTSNPKAAFLNLVKRLAVSGEIAIYVYKQKAPIREWADDFIREKISNLSYEDSQKSMRQLTEFGRVLSNLELRVKVDAVDVLGIEAGEYEIQRLIYHFFLKCFWSNEMSFDNNVAINYDWYHPQLCTRHTLSEINDWFTDANLSITHSYQDHYGITVRGKKSEI